MMALAQCTNPDLILCFRTWLAIQMMWKRWRQQGTLQGHWWPCEVLDHPQVQHYFLHHSSDVRVGHQHGDECLGKCEFIHHMTLSDQKNAKSPYDQRHLK